jgi:hypothetical protein
MLATANIKPDKWKEMGNRMREVEGSVRVGHEQIDEGGMLRDSGTSTIFRPWTAGYDVSLDFSRSGFLALLFTHTQ